MKSILLIYKTKTGFTKKYVDWINNDITCQTVPYDQINHFDINNYDIIIYGAGIQAGRIQGLKKFKYKVQNLINKKIVVFATGGAPCTEEVILAIKTNNFSTEELDNVQFFYFQSGIDYKKMRLHEKIVMKTYSKILGFKSNKSALENGTGKAILNSYDHSSSKYIKPMIDYLNCI